MTLNLPERHCATCDTPLPRGSRQTRRFCSTSCRVREWDRRNRPQPPDARLELLFGPTNPKHYHARNGMTILVGHRNNEPWFGTSCPAECPGLGDGETYEPIEEYWRH